MFVNAEKLEAKALITVMSTTSTISELLVDISPMPIIILPKNITTAHKTLTGIHRIAKVIKNNIADAVSQNIITNVQLIDIIHDFQAPGQRMTGEAPPSSG